MSFWQNVVYVLGPAASIVVGIIPVGLCMAIWRRQRSRLRRRSPLTQDLLRPPGHSLREKIEQATERFVFLGILCAFLPLLLYIAHVSRPYFGANREAATGLIFYLVVLGVGYFVLIRMMLASIEKLRTHVIGLDGELATGEELNQLMLHGCRVFHDVPGKWGNADHVIVAPTGVFSIETKLKEKPKDEDRGWELDVDYNRGVLKFPGWEEPIPIEQAQWEAKELSEWLSKAVGEPVKVTPVIALPGWYIRERIGRWTVPVITPSKPELFFLKQKGDSLMPQRIQQIAHQLEQRCRDVKPANKQD